MVYLVYIDDYGSIFSPYYLQGVYRDIDAASRVAKAMCGMIIEHNDLGDDMSCYPKTLGGMFDSNHT